MNPKKCRLCNADEKYQTTRAEYVYGGGKERKFWECSKCSLVYMWPPLSLEDEKIFYAKEFEKFMSDRSGSDRNWSGPEAHILSNQDNIIRRWEFLKNFLNEGDDVLEVGCSSGFMLDDFKKKKMNAIGIEPSGGFGDFLTQKGHEHYLSLDALKEKKPNAKFDTILHFFVFEHIRDPFSFLQEQLKMLKPGGVIISEIPNVNDPLTSLYKIPAFEKFYWSIAHHYYYSPKSLTPIIEKLDCSKFEFKLEQRYDLSNHITWMQDGKPGGQGRYNHIFSERTINSYKQDLVKSSNCDTFFLYVWK